ncbi:MAG TPA: hypothetical protein VM936_18600 [Pyrinomonadaceae bacterium]|jgi:hypothetical protein|nr:hypothetical protein [Pyrinomonadaceae bacterium]
MEETKRTFADDEGEETMVSPRFDDQETVLARPVVPFEEVDDAPAVAASTASMSGAPPHYSSLRGVPRRSLVAGLVLVSVLVGSVLGVAGLYFYQKQKSADAQPAAEQQQADVPAAQPTTETASESKGGETSAPAAVEPSTPAPVAAEPEEDDDADTAKDRDSDEAEASPVAERRGVSEDRAPAPTQKRGKKGARDEETQRAQRAPRYDEDTRPVVRDEVSDGDRRQARRVGVITYRPRRARPRRDRDDTPDRLRRIFEGQP